MFGRFGVALLLLVAACAEPIPPPAPAAKSASVTGSLYATLSLSKTTYAHDSDVDVTVVITNRGASPAILAARTLDAAQLLLEVEDASGKPVPTMPPPMPTSEQKAIGPEERISRTLLLNVFSPPLPPGEYSVSTRGAGIDSNVVRFRIVR